MNEGVTNKTSNENDNILCLLAVNSLTCICTGFSCSFLTVWVRSLPAKITGHSLFTNILRLSARISCFSRIPRRCRFYLLINASFFVKVLVSCTTLWYMIWYAMIWYDMIYLKYTHPSAFTSLCFAISQIRDVNPRIKNTSHGPFNGLNHQNCWTAETYILDISHDV